MRNLQQRQFLYGLAALVFGFMSASAFSDGNLLLGVSRLLVSFGAALAAVLVIRADMRASPLRFVPVMLFAVAAIMTAVSLFSL